MTRVIHTGDTHLGYQQYHRAERRQDFLAAFRQVAEDATRQGVDAVVHAGDLFHDRRPTLSDIMGAIDVLRTLREAGVPFLAIVGNHEAKRDAQWLDLFESLGLAKRLDSQPVEIGDVAFYGLDFVPRANRDDIEYEFEPHETDHAALVSHGLFEPFAHGDWDAREILDEATVEFDALLLGDDHQPHTKHLDEPHPAWLTYCGSTERASADEREDRGYNLLVFEDGVDVRRRALDTREFVFIDIELGESEGIERVREQIGQYEMEDAVVVVTIQGEGDAITPATVEEYADEEGALVVRVNDRREVTDESELDVTFADPDAAVTERVRDLGLSPAARDVDETIRASKVADSNVADEVEDRVETLVSEGNPKAFEPASDETDDNGDSPEEGDKSEDDTTTEGDEGTTDDNPAEGEEDSEVGETTDGDKMSSDESDSPDGPRSGSGDDADGQVTMEDYL